LGSPAKVQTPTHWNLIGHSTTTHRRPCYRPAVFFLHLPFIAPLLPQVQKIETYVKNVNFSIFKIFLSAWT
jgi:hypothetical protein